MIKHSYPTLRYRYGGSSHSRRSRYRYGGTGIFTDLIGRTLIKDNVNHLINRVGRSKLAQKAVSTILKGAKNILKPKRVVKAITTAAIDSAVDNKRKKREHQEIVNSVIHQLSDKEVPSRSYIDEVINSGKGIVYD